MLEQYRERTLEVGEKVKVYFNLHKNEFSVKSFNTGLVVAHGNNILLKNPSFIVNEKGREKVIEQKRKNVHAFTIGTFQGTDETMNIQTMDSIYYNPYRVKDFMVGNSKANSMNFQTVLLKDKRVYGKK